MIGSNSWVKLRTWLAGSAFLVNGFVIAQTPPPAYNGQTPKYYQSTVNPSPTPPGSYVRPPGGKMPEDAPPRGMATQPPPGTYIPPDRPIRITAPVIAGPEGVRPVSSQDVEMMRQPTSVDTPMAAVPVLASTPPGGTPPAVVPGTTRVQVPGESSGYSPVPAPTPSGMPSIPTPLPEPTPPTGVGSSTPPPAYAPPPSSSAPSAYVPVPAATSGSMTPPPATTTSVSGSIGSVVTNPSTPPASTPVPSSISTGTGVVTPLPGASLPSSIPTTSTLSARLAPNVTVDFEAPESVGVGLPIAYSLVVRNTGTCPVYNVRVDEEIPSNCTFVSSEPAPETTNNSRLSWSLSSLEAGAEKRIKVTVKSADEGEIRSRAAVSFTTAVESKIRVTRPRLSLSMTGPDVVRVGDPVPLKVTIANVGTGTALKIPLKAQYTDGLKFRNERGDTIDSMIETEWANLPAGQSKSFTITLVSFKPGAQQCVFSAQADGNPAETAKVALTLVEPQLIAKQTGPAKCFVRAEPQYQIELSNPGSATTDPITAWSIIPDGFEFVQASDGGVYTPSSKAVMWRLAGMPAGSAKTVSVKLRSVLPTTASIKSVIQSGNGESAPEKTGNTGVAQVSARSRTIEVRCETAVRAEGVPALRFEVVGIDGLVEVGKEAIYEIRVTNQGTGPCTNVAIEAELSDGTSAINATGATTGRTAGQRIVFDPIAQLGVRGEAVYKVRVKGNQAGDMRFRVKMMCDQVRSQVVKEEITRFYKEQ